MEPWFELPLNSGKSQNSTNDDKQQIETYVVYKLPQI